MILFLLRPLCSGQRGEVYEVNGDQVAVIWDVSVTNTNGEKDDKHTTQATEPSVYWINGILPGIVF